MIFIFQWKTNPYYEDGTEIFFERPLDDLLPDSFIQYYWQTYGVLPFYGTLIYSLK